jgi:hypothetical protein
MDMAGVDDLSGGQEEAVPPRAQVTAMLQQTCQEVIRKLEHLVSMSRDDSSDDGQLPTEVV